MDILPIICLCLLISMISFYIGIKTNDMRIRGRIQRIAKTQSIDPSFFSGDAINHIFQLNILEYEKIVGVIESILD